MTRRWSHLPGILRVLLATFKEQNVIGRPCRATTWNAGTRSTVQLTALQISCLNLALAGRS